MRPNFGGALWNTTWGRTFCGAIRVKRYTGSSITAEPDVNNSLSSFVITATNRIAAFSTRAVRGAAATASAAAAVLTASIVLSAAIALWATIVLSSPASAERRVALVVGNAQYKNPGLVLTNPRRDAQDVAAALRGLGFEVILTLDASKRDFDLAMTKFARAAIDADAALFYYAGHALQSQGQNYLMPTDAELEDEISVRYQTVWLDDVRAGLDHARGVKIMILDACRNNPLADMLPRRAAAAQNVGRTRGLARIDNPQGTVVIYATAPDQVAAEGTGRNSPFTAALLNRLEEAGVEIGTMFRRVAADVSERTGGRQHPELTMSLTDDYYLNQNDRPAWERVKDSSDPAALRDFINRFASSTRASDARYRLTILERDLRLRQDSAHGREKPAEAPGAEARRIAPPGTETAKTEGEGERQKQRLSLVPPAARPPPNGEEACRRDQDRLARLRTAPEAFEAARFARELACEKLRPQLQRLLESIPGGDEAYQEGGPGPAGDAGKAGRTPAAVAQDAALTPEQLCKRDQERLARLRVTQVAQDVIRFERELGCERLRTQVLRLRESLGAN